MLVFSCSRLCVTSSGCRRTVDSSGHTMSDGMVMVIVTMMYLILSLLLTLLPVNTPLQLVS